MLTPDRQRRYARHLTLPEIGEAGQARLLASSVLVVGAGGLGAASIGYLAAMGIGRIGVVDPDRVELSNLQRQLLFETHDIGRLKVDACADRIDEINPEILFAPLAERLTEENADRIIGEFDLVLDGTDNFATRFAVHAATFRQKKPLISAAISALSGQLSTFKAYLGHPHPCYRCLVHTNPEIEHGCAQEGMLGALAGVMGSLQAVEAVKELLGTGQSLSGWLLCYDALAGDFRKVLLQPDNKCELCGPTSHS